MKKIFLNFIVLISTLPVFGQTQQVTKGHKGEFFALWGWNVEAFTKSDIRFKGNNYDFTLYDVAAEQKIDNDISHYYNPGKITIPQVNYAIGYFINDHYYIKLAQDHMKYVMSQNQTVAIDGKIAAGNTYDGVYKNQKIKLTEDFLTFEHTDGLNYINLGINRFDDISSWLGIHKKNFQINTTCGVEAGVMFPKTNAKLFNNDRSDRFHVAGYGSSIVGGFNFTFYKHFFLETNLKGGYISMSDIRTTLFAEDIASQHFYFVQANALVGARFRF